MEESLARLQQPTQTMEGSDRCTEQHTAANDTRNGSTWKHCDDTGLFGMACRHDQMIRMINIVKSGEKSYFPLTMINHMVQVTKEDHGARKKLAFLYDIGCNIEKGIIRRQMQLEAMENDTELQMRKQVEELVMLDDQLRATQKWLNSEEPGAGIVRKLRPCRWNKVLIIYVC
ncbi:uncharacterized protein PGTG_16349 [Puccinia graminis f. sp. tritici CRL 75-36-700-3]|uniref:Uncharacterized protein n=1 Tax=Puccinia graminis f. sp. tritici (strain CRL 75-36-700-3 / race SCCL) TaxID=418459 RepID=E3L149_PUCGT|nr:uncharacterized protein PGTG_16349 [Puccinia graminis f. sp. tritici CRL 75-36-700-3]EFP90323.1 hypothetical protein PGTG_16349 [Puccinia graminis f. sp. tritici CRL 75-36-700-3]